MATIKVDDYVKILDWCGRVVDIAKSDTRTMLLVESPKGIWLNHPTEWIEYNESRVALATEQEVEFEINRRRGLIYRMQIALEEFEYKYNERILEVQN